MKTCNIQISNLVNSSKIREEIIDGDPHLIVPSVALVYDIVMNGLLYSKEEIDKGYSTLEGSPSPCPHPVIEGEIVSAHDQRAMNLFSVGAWNRNVHIEGDKVVMEKVINKRVAGTTETGRELLNAIQTGAPIHTSTGLSGMVDESQTGESKGKTYYGSVLNMRFDHDAFLLHEPGAATPSEGVGVNVINSGHLYNNGVLKCNLYGKEETMELNNEEVGLLTRIMNKLTGNTSEEKPKDGEDAKPADTEATDKGSEEQPKDEKGSESEEKPKEGDESTPDEGKEEAKDAKPEDVNNSAIAQFETVLNSSMEGLNERFTELATRLDTVETALSNRSGVNMPLNNSVGGKTINFVLPESTDK